MSKNKPTLKTGWRPEFVYITAPAAPSEELQVLSNNLTRQINQALEIIQQRMELLRGIDAVVDLSFDTEQLKFENGVLVNDDY